MQLASHELFELSELIAGCYNTVTCMASFINKAEDPELKELLQRHFPLHVADYNLKVEFVQSQTTPGISKFKPAELKPMLNSFTNAPVSNFSPVSPRTIVQQHNDREIATSYLLNHYAIASVECSDPDLWTFLENAFLNSNLHAYEVWQYMTKKGYYPLIAAPPIAIQTIASIYQPVNQL